MNITFKQRAKLAKQILSKQLPFTYEQAKNQIAFLKANSSQKNKKKGPTELNPKA